MEKSKKDIYIFLAFIAVAFLLFFPSYTNLNYFWDDERFVFLNPEFLQVPSWYSFWIPGSSFYKTWPLGYAIFWALSKLSAPFSGLIFYKTLNIIFHALNSFLVFRFIKKIKLPYPAFISLFFLAHPFHVETVSWVFQLLTIISFTFFMLSMNFFLDYVTNSSIKSISFAFLFFIFSLWTKSIALLAPFLFLLLLVMNKSKLKSYLFLTPFFVISLYLGLINQQGTNSISQTKEESTTSKQIVSKINENLAPAGEKTHKIKQDRKKDYFDFIYPKKTKETEIEFDGWEVLAHGSWHYPSKLIAPIGLQFIQESLKFSFLIVIMVYLILVSLPTWLAAHFSENNFYLIPGLSLVFLTPYLGVSFISFFYWSNVSNRYAYYFSLVLVLIVGLILKYCQHKSVKIIVAVYFLALSCQTVVYGFKFNNPQRLYEEILTYKPHPAIYSLLFEQYYMKLDLEKSEKILDEGLKKFPTSNALLMDKMRIENLRLYHQQLKK